MVYIGKEYLKPLHNRILDSATAETVNAFVERVEAVFPVRNIILFGSRARGHFQNDSDADVAIVLSGPLGRFMTTKLEMADMAYDVMLKTGIRVEALPIWEEEWANPDEYRNPMLLHNIEREGVLIR